MSKRRYGFDNVKMTALMAVYAKNTKDLKLRNKIVRRSMPLVDAVIAKKRYLVNHPNDLQADLKQEMLLKLIKALPKYQPGRSNAFAFIWTVICNIAISKNERLSKLSLSLSTDENILQEAESQPRSVFQSPENQYVLTSISDSLARAFSSNGFQVPRKKLHKKAIRVIRRSIASGDLFYKRVDVLRELRGLGLKRADIQSYVDYALVVTRKKLLLARETADAIERTEVDAILSQHASE